MDGTLDTQHETCEKRLKIAQAHADQVKVLSQAHQENWEKNIASLKRTNETYANELKGLRREISLWKTAYSALEQRALFSELEAEKNYRARVTMIDDFEAQREEMAGKIYTLQSSFSDGDVDELKIRDKYSTVQNAVKNFAISLVNDLRQSGPTKIDDLRKRVFPRTTVHSFVPTQILVEHRLFDVGMRTITHHVWKILASWPPSESIDSDVSHAEVTESSSKKQMSRADWLEETEFNLYKELIHHQDGMAPPTHKKDKGSFTSTAPNSVSTNGKGFKSADSVATDEFKALQNRVSAFHEWRCYTYKVQQLFADTIPEANFLNIDSKLIEEEIYSTLLAADAELEPGPEQFIRPNASKNWTKIQNKLSDAVAAMIDFYGYYRFGNAIYDFVWPTDKPFPGPGMKIVATQEGQYMTADNKWRLPPHPRVYLVHFPALYRFGDTHGRNLQHRELVSQCDAQVYITHSL